MGLLPLQILDATGKFLPLLVLSLRHLLEADVVLLINLLHQLVMRGLGISLGVEMHFLLQFKRLLELVLELLVIGFRLVTLSLEEVELAFPKSALLIEHVLLFLQFCLSLLELDTNLLVVKGCVDLRIFEALAKSFILGSQVVDFGLVVHDQLLTLLFQISKFLVKNSSLSLTFTGLINKTLLNILELLPLCLILCLGCFFFLKEAL